MDDTIAYYNQNADAWISDCMQVEVTGLYKGFLEKLPARAKILDLGCGAGRDSLFFLKRGYQVVAVDASEAMCRRAAACIKQDVHCMLFQEMTFANEFDGVWACASLLHVPYDELPLVFEKVCTSLSDGGIFYASFQYGQYEGMRDNRYYTDMDEERLRKIITVSGGFHAHEITAVPDERKERAGLHWLNAILQKR